MPVDMPTLLVFIPFAVVMALTPGPGTLIILSRSLASGPAAGIATGLGVCAGLYVYAAAAGLGLAGVFDYSPLAYDAVRVVGVLYLLYLALQAFRAGGVTAPVAAASAARSFRRFFWQGVLNDLTNPKAAFFFVALFPQFLVPEHGDMLGQALILNTIANIAMLVVVVIIALGAGRLGRFLARHPLAARLQQWFVGCVFVGLAARLALSERRP